MATVNEIIELVLKAKPDEFETKTDVLCEVILSPNSMLNFEWSENGDLELTERGKKEYVEWSIADERTRFNNLPLQIKKLMKEATLKRLSAKNRAFKNISNIMQEDLAELEISQGVVGTLSGNTPGNISDDWKSALSALFGSEDKENHLPNSSNQFTEVEEFDEDFSEENAERELDAAYN